MEHIIQGIITWIGNHPFIAGMVAAIVLSSAVRALPKPEPMGSRLYLWFYNFTHRVLANWELAKRKGASGRPAQ